MLSPTPTVRAMGVDVVAPWKPLDLLELLPAGKDSGPADSKSNSNGGEFSRTHDMRPEDMLKWGKALSDKEYNNWSWSDEIKKSCYLYMTMVYKLSIFELIPVPIISYISYSVMWKKTDCSEDLMTRL